MTIFKYSRQGSYFETIKTHLQSYQNWHWQEHWITFPLTFYGGPLTPGELLVLLISERLTCSFFFLARKHTFFIAMIKSSFRYSRNSYGLFLSVGMGPFAISLLELIIYEIFLGNSPGQWTVASSHLQTKKIPQAKTT